MWQDSGCTSNSPDHHNFPMHHCNQKRKKGNARETCVPGGRTLSLDCGRVEVQKRGREALHKPIERLCSLYWASLSPNFKGTSTQLGVCGAP